MHLDAPQYRILAALDLAAPRPRTHLLVYLEEIDSVRLVLLEMIYE